MTISFIPNFLHKNTSRDPFIDFQEMTQLCLNVC